nr:hypothetical protein CFP56_43872 [Quercus suber]
MLDVVVLSWSRRFHDQTRSRSRAHLLSYKTSGRSRPGSRLTKKVGDTARRSPTWARKLQDQDLTSLVIDLSEIVVSLSRNATVYLTVMKFEREDHGSSQHGTVVGARIGIDAAVAWLSASSAY